MDLWNFAAVVEVRGDEHLAGSGLGKNVLPSAAVPPFVAQDLSELQKKGFKNLCVPTLKPLALGSLELST